MERKHTRRELLLTTLAAMPLLAGCTISGSKIQQRLEQSANATPTSISTIVSTSTTHPTPQATSTGLPTPQPTATPGGKVTLRFGVSGNDAERIAYNAIANAYTKTTPNMQVHIEQLPSTGLPGIQKLLAAGAAPDVLTIAWDFLAPLAQIGGLDDLTSLLGAGILDDSSLFSTLTNFVTASGQTLALPLSFNPQVLIYNVDQFKAANLPPPTVTFTWDRFETAATQLTTSGHWGFATTTAPFSWLPWVWAAGGSLFDHDISPTTCTLDQQPAITGLQRFAGLWLTPHGTPPPGSLPHGATPIAAFAAGAVAMAIGYRSQLPALLNTNFTWQVAYVPQGPGGHGATYIATLAAVSRSSTIPLPAARFVGFLSTDTVAQNALAQTNTVVPARRSAATGPDFRFVGGHIDDTVFVNSLLFCTQPPQTALWSSITTILQSVLVPIWKDARQAPTAAKTAAVKVNTLLKHAKAAAPALAITAPTPTPQPSPSPVPTPPRNATPTPKS